jgi:hypothetical protein
MTAVRRPCACRGVIESEPDPASIEHAVSVDVREPKHRAGMRVVELSRELVPPARVRIVPTFSGPASTLPMPTLRRVS